MRNSCIVAASVVGLLISPVASAQIGRGEAGHPIAFVNSVSDICFQVARGKTISQIEAAKWQLSALPFRPIALNGMYPQVKDWFALNNNPDNIFIGVGDATGKCHIVLVNSQASRKAYANLIALLRATGFNAYEDSSGRAITLFVHKSSAENMLVLLKGLTDATDGIGPQVSVDVSTATDAQLRSFVGKP
jgi:hypothetical protein